MPKTVTTLDELIESLRTPYSASEMMSSALVVPFDVAEKAAKKIECLTQKYESMHQTNQALLKRILIPKEEKTTHFYTKDECIDHCRKWRDLADTDMKKDLVTWIINYLEVSRNG